MHVAARGQPWLLLLRSCPTSLKQGFLLKLECIWGSGHQEIRRLLTPQCWLCKHHPQLIYCSAHQNRDLRLAKQTLSRLTSSLGPRVILSITLPVFFGLLGIWIHSGSRGFFTPFPLLPREGVREKLPTLWAPPLPRKESRKALSTPYLH